MREELKVDFSHIHPTDGPQDNRWPHHEANRIERPASFAASVGAAAEIHHFRYVLRFEAFC